ncbi:hypothetical protein ACQKM9_05005 [Viridibacillus sp. NPDC093762]|uniref:hypothetical protein n=1 Tax=Viridibacillus sp. NPDC093762 TaxID=3390720 RepID=UPI003D04A035
MKRVITPLSTLLFLLLGGVWFIQQSQVHVEASTNHSLTQKNREDELKSENCEKVVNAIRTKLKEENIPYQISIAITFPEERVDVLIAGRQSYIDENEKNIQKATQEAIRKTIYKDYSVHVNKTFTYSIETDKQYNELNKEKIRWKLKDKGYTKVQRVLKEIEPNLVGLSILTNIRPDDATGISYGKEIEKEIQKELAKEIVALKTKNLEVEIHVYDISGEKVM